MDKDGAGNDYDGSMRSRSGILRPKNTLCLEGCYEVRYKKLFGWRPLVII